MASARCPPSHATQAGGAQASVGHGNKQRIGSLHGFGGHGLALCRSTAEENSLLPGKYNHYTNLQDVQGCQFALMWHG
jgi:hypothetical protein